jgi:ribulose-phosphate 3-epimerase
MLEKISELRNTIVERNLDIDIEVDGGIKANWTISQCCAAGAN